MALERDTILLENLRDSMNFYQRSLVWAMTASAAFFLLTLSLKNTGAAPVSVLYGELSRPSAWAIALGLSFVLGFLAASSIQNAKTVFRRLASLEGIEPGVLEDVLYYPSLATSAYGLVRVGTVLFSPITVLIAFGIELNREWTGTTGKTFEYWLGLLLFIVIIASPYVFIAIQVWSTPFESWNRKDSEPPA